MFLSRLSIKHQLLIIVFTIALPAIGIIISSGIQERQKAIHAAKMETQRLAEAIVSEQKNLVASTKQLFIVLSQLPELKTHKHIQVQAMLAEILRLSPRYSNVFIADTSGAVWASAIPLSEAVSVADRRYFKSAVASGNLSSGEYHIARTSKKPTLNLGYPLKDNTGKVTDVICVGLSLDFYSHILDSYKLPQGTSFVLLDHKGIVLTRAVESEKYMGKPSNPEIFKHMLEGPEEETSIGTSSVVGDNRIQTYRKLSLEGESTPYMYVRAGIPTRIAMAESNAALGKNLTIYSVSLLAALFLSWLLGKKYIIDKVLALQQSSQRLADGDLNIRISHVVAGGELGKLGQAFDNMAQKLTSREQALRESRNNYQDIFNTTLDAVFVTDESGRIIEANKASEIMFGYTCEELLHMSMEDLISGEQANSIQEALVLMEKSSKEGTHRFEWISNRKNGKSFWAELAIAPFSISGKKRVLVVARDITEHKEMEQVKEAMFSTISHEMRTPLTAILGFLDFVIENKVDEAKLNEYHTIMRKEGERLNEMITNFLDMQRLKAKLHEYNFKPIEVTPLLEDAIAVFANPSAKHSIIVASPSNLPPILGDGELLHQAICNLLSNALKYSPEGSKVILDARLEGDTVTLLVKDEGIGIPSGYLDKIFDMFYRVDNPSWRKTVGTGLGLALVKEIVSAHNGQVWVESNPGQGSTFYVSLPVDINGHCKATAVPEHQICPSA
jgi:PAS domain S-box-containing protein